MLEGYHHCCKRNRTCTDPVSLPAGGHGSGEWFPAGDSPVRGEAIFSLRAVAHDRPATTRHNRL